jgi:hypothetical protein
MTTIHQPVEGTGGSSAARAWSSTSAGGAPGASGSGLRRDERRGAALVAMPAAYRRCHGLICYPSG